MTEPTPQDPQPQGQEPAQPQPDPQKPQQTPPWGSDEQFDPERAWQLLQNTRADLDKAKAAPRLTEEQQQRLSEYDRLVEAGKSEQQRLEEQAAQNARRAETAETEALRYRTAMDHGITDPDDLAMLGTGTAEELKARAEWIASKNAAAAAAATPQATPPPTARNQQVFPGATPPAVPAVADDAYPSSWLSPTQAARIAGGASTP